MARKKKPYRNNRSFRYRNSSRNYRDPNYIKWRNEVLKRDKYKCQFPGCRCRGRRKVQTHHIRRWAEFPALRFTSQNGITLCYDHHKMIQGKEDYYMSLFDKILIEQIIRKLARKKRK